MSSDTNSLSINDSLSIGDYGLVITGKPTYEQWETIGRTLFAEKQKIQWNLGDWINYGESRYGEKYTQALNETDYRQQTLENYASVARRVPVEERRKGISFSIYQDAISLPQAEREILFDGVELGIINREDVRQYKRKRREQSTASVNFKPTLQEYVDAPVHVKIIDSTAYAVIQLPPDYPITLLTNWIARIPKPQAAAIGKAA